LERSTKIKKKGGTSDGEESKGLVWTATAPSVEGDE
jgi:hypothetical protein